MSATPRLLTDIVLNLLAAGVEIHALRDPTRGGLAATLNEIAGQSRTAVEIRETQVPIQPAVAAACEALGLDPFTVANEGKMVVVVAPQDADRALKLIRGCRYGQEAQIIGEVKDGPAGRVQVRTVFGTARLLEMPSGELLPTDLLDGLLRTVRREVLRFPALQPLPLNRPGLHLLFQQLPQHVQVGLLFLGHLEQEVFGGRDLGFFGKTAVQVQGLGFQHHGNIQGAH